MAFFKCLEWTSAQNRENSKWVTRWKGGAFSPAGFTQWELGPGCGEHEDYTEKYPQNLVIV